MTSSIRRLAGAALAGALLCGCLDLSPAPYHRTPRDAGPPAEAGAMAEAGPADACGECIFGDGAPCRAAWDECDALPKCAMIVQCAYALGCLQLGSLADVIPCAQACLDKADITSTQDPAATAAAPLFYCTRDTSTDSSGKPKGCAAACVR